MEFKNSERLNELEELKYFADEADKEINDLITSVGWTMESIENYKPLPQCPFDPCHYISEQRLEEHVEQCQWKAEGYGNQYIPLSEPSVTHSLCSIKFNEQLLDEVLQQAKSNNPSMQIGAGDRLIPRTSDRLISDFTSDERKAVYDYVIAKTIKPDVGEDIADLNRPKTNNENNSSSSSYLELLVQERNLKRRRTKHRGVHTNKKSQLEILREVINQQMEMLEEYIVDKTGQQISEEPNHSEQNINEYDKMQQGYKRENEEESSEDAERQRKDHKYYQHNERHDYNQPYGIKKNYDQSLSDKKDYEDDREHAKHSRKSSRDHERGYRDDRNRKNHLDERKYHRSNSKTDKYYSRHDKYDKYSDRDDKYDVKHSKHKKKHGHRRSPERDSSRHSHRSKYEDKKSSKRRE